MLDGHDGVTTAEDRKERLASSAGRCPTGRASTCSAMRSGKVIYVGKAKSIRKRVASHFSNPVSAARRDGRRDRRHRVRARLHRGRGAAGRAELHQAVPAALQHPPARRQVLSVHRDLDGRGVPARLLHARAPPPRPPLLRPVLQRQARRAARSTCSARSSCSARARAPSRAGAAARRAWTTTSSAAGRPASATSRAEEYRSRSTASSPSCPGRYREIERDLERRMKEAAAEQEFEQAALERNRLRAVRSLLERQRVANESVGTLDAVAVAVDGTDANAQVFQVRDGVLSDRQSFYLANVAERGRSATSPRSSSCSTTPTRCRSRRRSSSGRGRGPRRARRGADASAAARRVEVRAAERGDKRRILDLAERNARLALDQERLKVERRRQQRVEALDGLQAGARGSTRCRCASSASTSRNLMGTNTVASMVVFEGGAPKKSDYRRFTSAAGPRACPDDFAAMEEVLSRRFAQWERQQDLSPARPQAQRVVRDAAQPHRHRRRPGPARRRPARARAASARAGRRGHLAGQAASRRSSCPASASRCAWRTTRPRSSCCSASATRRTASPSRTTARAATGDDARRCSTTCPGSGRRASARCSSTSARRRPLPGRLARAARGGAGLPGKIARDALRVPAPDRRVVRRM